MIDTLAPLAEDEADPASQVLDVHHDGETGDVTITVGEPDPPPVDDTPPTHDENLAEVLALTNSNALGLIANRLIRQIEADDASRKGWLDIRAEGIEKLGFMVEKPDASGGPVAGISRVRHPILGEAVLRFQANASGELLPTDGPVKVRNDAGLAAPTLANNAPISPGIASAAVGNSGGIPVPGQLPAGFAASRGMAGAGLAGGVPDVGGVGGVPPAGLGHNGGPPLDVLSSDDRATILEDDLNHYLTAVATEYVPSTQKMLLWVGLGGMEFKKVYHDPIKRRPTSIWVDAKDVIVANTADDIETAGRVTQVVKLRPAVLRRMQLSGVYRDVEFGAAGDDDGNANPVDRAIDAQQGVNTTTDDGREDEDRVRTIYECYCELDLPGYEHKDEWGITGLPLPYKVSIDKETSEVLEIRRNWREDDEDCTAKQVFVPFEFVPGIGFYSMGLVYILSNISDAATTAWRLAFDAAMLASFPGGLISEEAARQDTTNLMVGMGEFKKVKTAGMDIRQAVMPLPYKGPDASLIALEQEIVAVGQRVGGTAEMAVGEGKQDAPVGTTLALIENAQKIIDSVHKRLHAAQSREFQLLADLFREDPESFWRKRRKGRGPNPWDVASFLQALDDFDLVPQADPNTSSQMQRLGKVAYVTQLAQIAPQGLFDLVDIANWALREAKIPNGESFVNQQWTWPQPQAAPQDPSKMILAQTAQMKAQTEAQKVQQAPQLAILGHQNDLAIQQLKSQDSQRALADQAADRETNVALATLKTHADAAHQRAKAQADVLHAAADHMADHAHAQNDRAHDIAMQQRQHSHDVAKHVLGHATDIDFMRAQPPKGKPQ